MTKEQKVPVLLNITLWIAQILLSVGFIWAGAMKLFKPAEQLAAMWPWTAEHADLVNLTGVIDILAGLGLVLPTLLRIVPRLTVYASLATIALMIAAIIFHISRGEGAQIGVNIFFAVAAAFIAWGRGVKKRINAR
ncbi:MAG: DoxX family protein [Sporocytophaga sp.]|uniref:DoxX family protein n=1 Tax=Sporocytophaga sp. TaxID=2231183 RepID=UPI001B192B8A|nr:DoxX family protein [Sporocytophaga sp.]MBO9701025.1 DoxX family protein [Sporocytophaga sp.]